MAAQSAASNHIDITETFVRLYVFLAQSLDRCLDKAQRDSFPEKEHQAFLADTRNKLMEVLRVNPVVKGKVEEESHRVLALVSSYLQPSSDKPASLEQIKAERTILQIKLMALSDLLAVFRAL
ncbi:MAG: hypothetical protein AUH96_00510 [Nitrospirae bacterium 13_2_20CM_2_61_4]|jgi:hypothetical protein|nr:MAG: hypothetical protein AUH96_00510 [Nitrospirae bacterium 13_2_20CM_2_61_4]